MGSKFFVLGLKGAGKSALLRYLQILSEDLPNSVSRFTLFRSSFKKGEISEFQEVNERFEESHSIIVDDTMGNAVTEDFTYVWRYFLHTQIADLVTENPKLIKGNINDYEYFKNIRSTKIEEFYNKLKFIASGIKIKSLEVSKNPKLLLDIDWSDKETRFKFDEKLNEIEESFCDLVFSDDANIFLFIDEIELSVKNISKYNRDLCLVRDLIIVSNQYNEMFRNTGVPVKVISAIRLEIIDQVYLLGEEIDKVLIDFSNTLRWHDAVYSFDIHPLLAMACKRILAHKEMLKMGDMDIKEVCMKYILGIEISTNLEIFIGKQRTFLDKTWYRPRDIVNYFNLAKTRCKNHLLEYSATKPISREFANRLWRDLSEGLSAKYTPQEIKAVNQIFNGFQNIFTFESFMERVDDLADMYDEVAFLTETKRAASILSDLFTVGAVGNLHKGNVRYSFRGDSEIIIDQNTNFLVHQSLQSKFSMVL